MNLETFDLSRLERTRQRAKASPAPSNAAKPQGSIVFDVRSLLRGELLDACPDLGPDELHVLEVLTADALYGRDGANYTWVAPRAATRSGRCARPARRYVSSKKLMERIRADRRQGNRPMFDSKVIKLLNLAVGTDSAGEAVSVFLRARRFLVASSTAPRSTSPTEQTQANVPLSGRHSQDAEAAWKRRLNGTLRPMLRDTLQHLPVLLIRNFQRLRRAAPVRSLHHRRAAQGSGNRAISPGTGVWPGCRRSGQAR